MSEPKTFAEVVDRDCCRFITEDDRLCGNDRKRGKSYCEHHHKIATRPKKKKPVDNS